jgi:hypothetical protein
MMIQLFVNDIKGIRKLKISSKMINEIADLKEKIMVEIKQEQLLGQQAQKIGFGERIKSFFQQILKKKSTELSSPQVKETEQEELKLIMNIFNEIIDSFKSLRSLISDINISFFINSFFTITIGDIFKFPEFGREPSLMNLRNIQCQFNLLSFAVFLGIEPLIVLFLLLGGNPSLTNQLNQDASYQLMFFQMIFRNVAMGVKWNPREKNEDKVYGSYNPEVESKIQTYEKMIHNIQSIPNPTEIDKSLFRDISMRLRELKNRIQKEQAQQQYSASKPNGNSLTIKDLQEEIKSIREILERQQTQQQEKLQQEIVQKQSQPQPQPQPQPQLIQGQLKVGYNFERYLCSNNKLRRILTLLSIFGSGIDLSLLVLQSDIAKKYIVRTGKPISFERVSSSILIAMSKEKFLNEKNILSIDSKYVKYSVYDLLRYFLIFNGFDGSNFTKYFSIRNTGYRNNFETDNNDFITRPYRGAQSLGQQNLSALESMPFNFISNINETSKPFNYSFFFYLISNKDISVNHKIELGCISLLQGADPNIMPNIAQDILSQLDSKVKKLSICDIFKVFLSSNYERIIQIFKLYSPNAFSNGVWDDKLGEIQKIMETQKDMIRNLRRQQMNLQQMNLQQMNSPLANTTRPLSRQLSSLNLATTPLQPQKNGQYYNYNPLKLAEQRQTTPVISTVPIEQNLSTRSVLTTVPSSVRKLHPDQLALFQQPPITAMFGGSKIKLRTFHFLEPKSYNEHAFRAEKPIIAGKMAYDFLRMHYKLKKGSSIMFTIEDREKDRKYNYIGEKVNNKIIIKST